jgi:RNA polymerase sigma-70 factor (ECF subfamily)
VLEKQEKSKNFLFRITFLAAYSFMMSSADARTSQTLLSRVRQWPVDQHAWSQFVQRYAPLIRSWCQHWQLQEADALDVTQVVLQKLAEKMTHFVYDPSRSFRSWLRTMTHNVWSDLLRQRGPAASGDDRFLHLLDSIEARDELTAAVEKTYEQELLEVAMASVQLRVQPPTWEAFRLTALEGLSGAEAAARLGQSLTTVYKSKSNVQKLLQEEVRGMEGAGQP